VQFTQFFLKEKSKDEDIGKKLSLSLITKENLSFSLWKFLVKTQALATDFGKYLRALANGFILVFNGFNNVN
jgi:hypothetical protein